MRFNCLIPEDAHGNIFSNIEQIMEVNKTLLEYMEHTTIGEAFKYLAPFLKLYSSYANNHENAINLLQVKKMEIYLDKDMQIFVYFSHRIMYCSKFFPRYLVHILLPVIPMSFEIRRYCEYLIFYRNGGRKAQGFMNSYKIKKRKLT